MRTVYCIAFRGNEFLMIYNPKRQGWEMPGGKVEDGESDLEAARREFREESGMDVVIAGNMATDDCMVFAGRVGGPIGPAEMEMRMFTELPGELAFPTCEYMPLIAWARNILDAGSNSA